MQIFGEMGAIVIKVEPPAGSIRPPVALPRFWLPRLGEHTRGVLGELGRARPR